MSENMNVNDNHVKIQVYTRKPDNDYTESLSNSIHFAISRKDNDFKPLNQNYGILFASATISDKNTIVEKGLKDPYIIKTADGGYGITAIRVDAKGDEDEESSGQVLLWTTKDLITFTEHGLIRLDDEEYIKGIIGDFNSKSNADAFHRKDKKDKSTISIDAKTADKVSAYWNPISNTEIRIPENITISSIEQLEDIKAEAVYSDGSSAVKDIAWDLSSVDFKKPGTYNINGVVEQENHLFPLAKGYADPVMLYHDDKYYFLSTNDNKNDIGMYVREADSIQELFAPGYKESIILDVNEEKDFIQTFWAPEFHYIGGELYILFAVGGKAWGPQCHMMKLKRDGSIMNPDDWEAPVRVRKADGGNLTEDGITLDMTYFKVKDDSFLVWSYRKGIGTINDTGSMLYIAKTDEAMPYVIISEPVLLSRPLYGWENIQGTINNEGPYALVTDDMVYITYSGGAAGGYTYALGLLSIPVGGDILDVSMWKKSSTPVLSYYSINGIYGPGHNSFFKDKDGKVMILYHGEQELTRAGIRCSAMHRLHFDKEGCPVFDLSWERDLNKELVNVSTMLKITDSLT